MFKHIIVSVLILSIIASSAFASPIFSFSKVFETANKRAAYIPTVCCLPNAFTMKGSFNQVVISNGTLQSVPGSIDFAGDYNTGKIRQEMSYTINGVTSKTTNWEFKVSSSLTVSYDLIGGACSCRKLTDFNQWSPYCIPAAGTITKAKIGAYDALKIEYGSNGSLWTLREPQMTSDKCWLLSSFVVVSPASQEQFFYDMSEKVDGSIFNLPSQCPSLDKCLAQ